VIALDSEIGSAMTIETFALQRSEFGEPTASGNLEHFQIYMGLSSEDQLGTFFDDNYIEDTRLLVYDSDPFTFSAGYNEWIEFTLDTPFWYNGVDNLVIEIMWSWGEPGDHFLTWGWEADSRALFGYYGAPEGELEEKVSFFEIDGALLLEPSTFGSIKAELGSIDY